jgi:hypothetical protein
LHLLAGLVGKTLLAIWPAKSQTIRSILMTASNLALSATQTQLLSSGWRVFNVIAKERL